MESEKRETKKLLIDLLSVHVQFYVSTEVVNRTIYAREMRSQATRAAGLTIMKVTAAAAKKATEDTASYPFGGASWGVTEGDEYWQTWSPAHLAAQSVAINVIKAEMWEATREAVKKDVSPTKIAKITCSKTLSSRKQIQAAISEMVEKELPANFKILRSLDYVKMLLNFESKELHLLEETIPLQLLSYLLFLERMIRTTNNSSLLKEHRSLLHNLKLTDKYTNLFPPVVDVETHIVHNILPLTKVLIEIIVEYCQFCWNCEEQLDQAFDRLVYCC